MYVARVTFGLPDATSDAAFAAAEWIDPWLGATYHNGQLLGSICPVYREGAMLHYTVLIPEADALDMRHANQWVDKSIVTLRDHGIGAPIVTLLGEDMESGTSCHCLARGSLVLYTSYEMVGSPLQCGDCFGAVPLYTIPPLENGEYYEIKSWETDYQACDTLQMNCATGERFGLREMSRLDSSITRRGRGLCQQIETNTGIPVYYYLFRYYGRSLRQEQARRCPACGGEWLLAEPLYGQFDFCCEPCRLLSNIAYRVLGSLPHPASGTQGEQQKHHG